MPQHPEDAYVRAFLETQRDTLIRDGFVVGKFLGAGGNGSVYECGLDRVIRVIVEVAYGMENERPLHNFLVERESELAVRPAGLIRCLRPAARYPADLQSPRGLTYVVMEREWLRFDVRRACRAQTILSEVTRVWKLDDRGYAGMFKSFGYNPAIKIVGTGVGNLWRRDITVTPEAQRDAVSVMDALLALHRQGWLIGDVMTCAPGNLGFRGNTCVVSDISYATQVK